MVGTWKDLEKKSKENWAKLTKADEAAKKTGCLIGRYITEPHADGQAVYEIIKENSSKVTISVVTGIGDDWMIPYWGEEAEIDRSYAEQKINQRENLQGLFGSKC